MKRMSRDNFGIALPIVVIIASVATLLAFTVALVVQNQSVSNIKYAGQNKALNIAEAGIARYMWHLNKDSQYYKKEEYSRDELRPNAIVEFNQDGYSGAYYIQVEPPTTNYPVLTIRCTAWLIEDPSNRVTIQIKTRKKEFVQSVYGSDNEFNTEGKRVYWVTGDEVYGPIHTNGDLYIDGNPIFHNKVTYSGKLNVAYGSRPVYEEGIPQKVAPLTFPPSNSQLKTHAKINGHYYNGRTCIYLKGSSMDVLTFDGDKGEWKRYNNRPLPSNGVIYVDGTETQDPRYKWDTYMGNVFISGTLKGRLTIAAANNIYITAKDPTDSYRNAQPTRGIVYNTPAFDPAGNEQQTDDMLGLVANGFVRILEQDWPSTSYWNYEWVGNVAPYKISIHAAIFALNWSFELENYNSAPALDTVYLVGAITQKYRGAVGTYYSGSYNKKVVSGYKKVYRHDPRMAYDTPPHFLEPVNAGWEIIDWTKLPPEDIPGI